MKSRNANQARTAADRLHSAAIHVLRNVRSEDVASGVSAARLSALSVLAFGGPRTLGQLAAAEQVTPPSMSRIVTGLEQSGLARRESHRDDARAVTIRATAKGVRLLQRARERRIDRLAAKLGTLDAGEIRQIEQSAELVERALLAE